MNAHITTGLGPVNVYDQLTLGIYYAPQQVRQHGLTEAHICPFVSHGKTETTWLTYRVPSQYAWQYEEIQLSTPTSRPVLVLDCDQGSKDPVAAAYAGVLPFPSWVCWRRGRRSCHAAYCLCSPVLTREAAKPAPQAALGRIGEFFLRELKADPGYRGVLTHNPIHQQWETEWGHRGGYSLEQLSQFVPSDFRMPPKHKILSSEGRNSSLFLASMSFAGKPRNWGDWAALLDYLNSENMTFTIPLPEREVAGIAKSVHAIQERNRRSGRQQAGLSRIQASRGEGGGKRSGEVRRERTAERDAVIIEAAQEGESIHSLARTYNLARPTIRHILQRGGETKPKQDDVP